MSKGQAEKDILISQLAEVRTSILEVAYRLSAAQQDEIFLGVWSPKDLLAHLVGWDFTNVEAVTDILAGKLPGFYPHYDPNWEIYNAHLVARYKRDDFAEMLSSVENSHKQLLDLLGTVPASEFGKDRGLRFGSRKVTIAGLLQVEIEDERIHYTQLEKFASHGLKTR